MLRKCVAVKIVVRKGSFFMDRIPASALLSEKNSALADKIVQHLLLHPFDLLDTHRLMTRFRASPAIVQQALQQLETRKSDRQEGTPTSMDGLDEPTRKLIFFLIRHPHDLVDGHRLMRRFGVSGEQFQQALRWIATRVVDEEVVWIEEGRV
jgi:hypothetical protein